MKEAVVYGVASGKGGVGKSLLSVLLAAEFARSGDRVLLLDGAAGEGNLHVLLGARPSAGAGHFLPGLCGDGIRPAAVNDRLWFLSSEVGPAGRVSPDPMERARAHLRLTRAFDLFDTVIVDSGPGIDAALRATIRCSRLLVVAVPEAASLYSAYALIKSVAAQIPDLPCELVVNRITDPLEASRTHEILSFACRHYLDRSLRFLGSLPERARLRQAAQRPGRLLHEPCDEVIALVASLNGADRDGARRAGAEPEGSARESSCLP